MDDRIRERRIKQTPISDVAYSLNNNETETNQERISTQSKKSKLSVEGKTSRTTGNVLAQQQTSKTHSPNSELLSLLETPQIKRKTPGYKRSQFDLSSTSSHYFTPTSILKVKHMMRRSISPSSIVSSPTHLSKMGVGKVSSPLQTKLRFADASPDKELAESEDSMEVARFPGVKDTMMLKLKNPVQVTSFDQEEITEKTDLSTVVELAEDSILQPHFSEPNLKSKTKRKIILIIEC